MRTLARTLLCAWVLWSVSNTDQHGWVAMSYYETKAGCDQVLRVKGSIPDKDPIPGGHGVIQWTGGTDGKALIWQCLPDTVKP
jgi:hypothetical protein